MTLQEALQLAVTHHNAGRFADAENIYRQIIQQQPQQPDALAYLAVLLRGTGRAPEAIELAKRAAALAPQAPLPYFTLADALVDMRQFAAAIEAFAAGLARDPNNINAWVNYSFVLQQVGQFDDSIAACREVLKRNPDLPEVHNNLAEALRQTGRSAEGIQHAREAVRLRPSMPQVWFTLGNNLLESGEYDQAIAAFTEAIRLKPDLADAYNNLGIAQMKAGRAEPSLAAFERAVTLVPRDASKLVNFARGLEWAGRNQDAFKAAELAVQYDPNLAEAWNQYGITLSKLDRPQDAIAAYRKAIELRPDFANAHSNLGNAYREQGLIEDAIEARRNAIKFDPDHPHAWSNLLFTLHFSSVYDGRRILEEHRRWAELKADALAPTSPEYANDRSTDRPLKIAFVSADLRRHAVATFLLPLLEQLDHAQFHVTCYADVINRDPMTDEVKSHSDAWHFTTPLSDTALAEQIRRDQIDILFDLAVHASENRMLMFARKPAPVQVTYLGYPSTTGLKTMDWRLTDRFLDPPDDDRPFYSERSAYLESTYWCYRPPEVELAVEPSPLEKNGYVTFGCFNSFAKVSPEALAAWGRILMQLPNARLIIYANPGDHHQHVIDALGREGVRRDRFEFVSRVDLRRYLSRYGQIDVALDPFPYCGGTTTCDALWMGVPVVSLVGDVAVRRAGLSILSRIDLADLAVNSVDAYVVKAVALARDAERLKTLRMTLREKMLKSPLMDASAFARDFERVLRMMWADWCRR